MTTAYHSKYAAHALTLRSASDSLAKLGNSLFNATVDLNPHQIDAALFAFRSPLARGAILADEVGLGKTVEAGLIISQLWAEKKRRILVIVPTTLRKQWAQELSEKFFLPIQVLDTGVYNAHRREGTNPLVQPSTILICSYHFARAKSDLIRDIPWDLVVIDEAHRLRNVYKPGNKIARDIRDAIGTRPKILLTATPLQNSLLELYGLVTFIDEHLFGNLASFRAQYARTVPDDAQMRDLQHRLRPICQRTLRRQVTEYIRFTNRIPITQDFTPSHDEQRLYNAVSQYLQRDELQALPSRQRKLMTLVLRKLLASSTFAIAGTLRTLHERLERANGPNPAADDTISPEAIVKDFEGYEETKEEWLEEDEAETPAAAQLSAANIQTLRAEIEELRGHYDLAASITSNAKGDALLIALAKGFEKLTELAAQPKAIIFTESKRTQDYLLNLLEANGYADRVMTFNGTNTDKRSGAIYQAWAARNAGKEVVTGSKAVDIRAALVEEFRERADIMIATEAAAEGVNLQFCSLVVNYDLPWNPQRIEQRIGRCHRYGQKHDVVVINFVNRKNAADVRVFELLSEKFRLFDGVFGASDEVLGALESGVDFERRIAEIYQNCRTSHEIDAAFNALQADLQENIATRMGETRAALIEHFDEEVNRRLRVNLEQANLQMDHLQKCLWMVARHELQDHATFDDAAASFDLTSAPGDATDAPLGNYRMLTSAREDKGAHVFRPGHPMAEAIIEAAKRRELPAALVEIDYTNHPGNIAVVEELVGKSGYLRAARLTIKSLDEEDHILLAGVTNDGKPLDSELCQKLLSVAARTAGATRGPDEATSTSLNSALAARQAQVLDDVQRRNTKFFDDEIEKLERWATDLKYGLEQELKELDLQIAATRKEAKLAADLETKLGLHRKVKDLESERANKRRRLYDAQDDVDAQKETLINNIEAKLSKDILLEPLFEIQWAVT